MSWTPGFSVPTPDATEEESVDVVTGSDLREIHSLPAGAVAQTLPRSGASISNAAGLVSGRLHLVAVYLPEGETITSISWMSGTTPLGTGVNQWFGLFDSARVPLRLTNDATNSAWAADTVKTLALSTPFETTYEGLHYLGVTVVAVTPPSWRQVTSVTALTGLAPALSGSSSTGLTNPASCPSPAGAMTATVGIPYAYAS